MKLKHIESKKTVKETDLTEGRLKIIRSEIIRIFEIMYLSPAENKTFPRDEILRQCDSILKTKSKKVKKSKDLVNRVKLTDRMANLLVNILVNLYEQSKLLEVERNQNIYNQLLVIQSHYGKDRYLANAVNFIQKLQEITKNNNDVLLGINDIRIDCRQ